MKKSRKENYFVRINPDILIPGSKYNWKSKYSRWLYVCLMLDYNYNIQNGQDVIIKVPYKKFMRLFQTTRKTLHAAVNNLVANGLLIKTDKQNRFQLIADKEIICKGKSKKGFVPVYNNFFTDLLQRATPRQLLIYYYLIYKNRVFDPDSGFIRTTDTQSTIVSSIHSRSVEVKAAIEGLMDLGLLDRDEDAIVYVRGQKIDSPVMSEPVYEEPADMSEDVPEDVSEDVAIEFTGTFKTIEEYDQAIKDCNRELDTEIYNDDAVKSLARKAYLSNMIKERQELINHGILYGMPRV